MYTEQTTENTTQETKVKIRKSDLITFREAGKTIQEIASHYSLTTEQVKRAMTQAGLSTTRKGIKRNAFELVED